MEKVVQVPAQKVQMQQSQQSKDAVLEQEQAPEIKKQGQAQEILKKFPKPGTKITGKPALVVMVVLLVLAGVGTGWLLSRKQGKKLGISPGGIAAPGVKTSTKEVGLADESTFRDSAEGVLEEGGIEGEGTHHLVREGGESQYVYLTSTVIDLDSFKGKKIQVWGETIAGRTAGWLMDVGRVKIIGE